MVFIIDVDPDPSVCSSGRFSAVLVLKSPSFYTSRSGSTDPNESGSTDPNESGSKDPNESGSGYMDQNESGSKPLVKSMMKVKILL